MPTKEEWLDDMQIKLSDVCNTQHWDLKQTPVLAGGTRSFVVVHRSESATVLISSLVCTRLHADIILEDDDVDYDKDQIRTLLARKFHETSTA